jgi:hypothetical protein
MSPSPPVGAADLNLYESQIAAIFGTAIITLIPATQFSGMIDPGRFAGRAGRWIGQIYPTSHFLTIARGTFSKALNLTICGLLHSAADCGAAGARPERVAAEKQEG